MFKVLCVTSRALCREDFLTRLERLAAARPAGIILREKDLPPPEYKKLAVAVMDLCARHGVPCILHRFVGEALELGAPAIHLPLPALRSLSPAERRAGGMYCSGRRLLSSITWITRPMIICSSMVRVSFSALLAMEIIMDKFRATGGLRREPSGWSTGPLARASPDSEIS